MEKMKLHKFLANVGIDSRRKCEKLIVQGRVKVNGIQVTKLGLRIDPDVDQILVDDEIIALADEENREKIGKLFG